MKVTTISRRSGDAERTELPTGGVVCGPGTGKLLYRIRQSHVAAHYGPLIAAKRHGAVKLDLVLRMIALSPQHAGERTPGFVLWHWSYTDLYDLAETPPSSRSGRSRSDRETRHLKRKWVIHQLALLREAKLVKTRPRGGGRPEIIVLRDDGSGDPFDDPAGDDFDDWYITIQGSLIAAGVVARWGAPQLAAYFAALFAEFYEPRGDHASPPAGTGSWWRSLAWFSHPEYKPTQRVRLPFSTSLLETGLARLEAGVLLRRTKMTVHPGTNRKLRAPRNRYRNRFKSYDDAVEKVTRFEPSRA